MTRVADISHQWLFISIASHLVISAHVTERSWASELAETMTVDPIRVVTIHRMSHDTSADLPIPRPEATARRNTSKSTLPPLAAMWVFRSRNTSRCHLRGPRKCSSGVPFSPHGKAKLTKASGSLASAGDHNLLIKSVSSCEEYFVVCITCGPLATSHSQSHHFP